jgi:diaminopimelate decarboxylase
METISNNPEHQIQGISLVDIAHQYGTPLYVYDADRIKHQYNRMINAFSAVDKFQLKYACKALSNISILKYIKSLGAGLDTVSIQEVQLGIKAGFDIDKIIFTPNGVSIQEIKEVAEMGVKINIDNLSVLEQFGHEMKNHPVCIRINPHIMAGGNSKISVGHIDSKFGISIYQMPLIKRIVENAKINVVGVHMHTGSDILDIEVFLNAAEMLFDVARNFPTISYLDLGSGFKVPYKIGDNETDIEYLGEKLSAKFNAFCKENNKELELNFEPGKYLVSESGYFLASVNTIKQTTSMVFAAVDSGFNHLIRPMFYDSYHQIINISNPDGIPRYYTVVGYICETDTFGSNRKINEIREKDILCFKNAGAYCFSMSSNYNSRLKPAEVLILNGKSHLIRERETFNDIMHNQIEIDF